MVPKSLRTVTISTTINGPELFLIPFRKFSFTQLPILWTAASFSCCLQSSEQGLSRSVKDTCYLNTRSFFTFSSSGRRISTSDLWRVSSIQWAGLSVQTPASPPLWRWRFLSGLRGSRSVQAASFLPLANDTTFCETSDFNTSPSGEAGRRNPLVVPLTTAAFWHNQLLLDRWWRNFSVFPSPRACNHRPIRWSEPESRHVSRVTVFSFYGFLWLMPLGTFS